MSNRHICLKVANGLIAAIREIRRCRILPRRTETNGFVTTQVTVLSHAQVLVIVVHTDFAALPDPASAKPFVSVKRSRGGQAWKDSMARIGYARVSTVDQHLDLQKDALRAAGCIRILEDHGVSGTDRKRSGLDRALKSLGRGDTLVVWRIDRLGRSLSHLLAVVERLRLRGIEFRSLSENIDTSSAGGKFVFHILGALAEFEKSLIRERTMAGLEAAKARGKRPGRRRALTDAQCEEIRAALGAGTAVRDIARRYNVHPRTVARGVERLG